METIRVSDALYIDLAPDGAVYGIELLNANKELLGGDTARWSSLHGSWPAPRDLACEVVNNQPGIPCYLSLGKDTELCP